MPLPQYMSQRFIDSVCITQDASVCSRPVQERTDKHIRHDEFISPGPTVKNTKKYTKVIIQEKHGNLFFQTSLMQMLRTTAAVQRTKARLTTFSSRLSAAVFKEDSHWDPHL